MPRTTQHRYSFPPRQRSDGSWAGAYEFSSQEEFSDSMPEDRVDEGPGIKKLFGEPVEMPDNTREQAWRHQQQELGRTPAAHIPYTLYSAIQERDCTWTRPFYTRSEDEYSDKMPRNWVENMEEPGLAMWTDLPTDTPLTK